MAGKSRSESGEAKNEIDFPISTSAATATAASSSSAPPPKKKLELNEDALIEILQRLDVEVILTKMQFMCKKWGEICKSRRLRRLKLLDYDRTESALTEALQKHPELEELHLIMMSPLHARDIEAIGTACPLLKSFTYNKHWQLSEDCAPPYSPSGIALAIAKTMPNLRHLSVFADPMKNEGLKAILDGCPHLESLDLRHCSGLDLEGDLGKRLCEQVKAARLPSDSTSDIEWAFAPSDEEEDDDGTFED